MKSMANAPPKPTASCVAYCAATSRPSPRIASGFANTRLPAAQPLTLRFSGISAGAHPSFSTWITMFGSRRVSTSLIGVTPGCDRAASVPSDAFDNAVTTAPLGSDVTVTIWRVPCAMVAQPMQVVIAAGFRLTRGRDATTKKKTARITPRGLQPSAFSLQHSAFSVQHSAFSVQHSALPAGLPYSGLLCRTSATGFFLPPRPAILMTGSGGASFSTCWR
jgi:hypothetical protein